MLGETIHGVAYHEYDKREYYADEITVEFGEDILVQLLHHKEVDDEYS